MSEELEHKEEKDPKEDPDAREQEEKKEEEEEKLALWPLILKGIKDGISGTVGKWVAGILSLIVLGGGGWIVQNTILNPIQNIPIEGYVHEYDNVAKPLEGATVYVVGKKETQFVTDENGYYEGTLKIRKKTDQVTLTCNKEGYEYFQKPVDIPAEKSPEIKTNFQLEPL